MNTTKNLNNQISQISSLRSAAKNIALASMIALAIGGCKDEKQIAKKDCKPLFNERYGYPSDTIIRFGIDISDDVGKTIYNKELQELLECNESFVISKATDGRDEDICFDDNFSTTGTLEGVDRGAYIYFYPEMNVKQQFEKYLKTVNFKAGDIVPIIDIEEHGLNYEYSGKGVQGVQNHFNNNATKDADKRIKEETTTKIVIVKQGKCTKKQIKKIPPTNHRQDQIRIEETREAEKEFSEWKNKIKKDLKEMCDLIENHYGVKPMIYTPAKLYTDFFQEFNEYPVWVAHYGKESDPNVDGTTKERIERLKREIPNLKIVQVSQRGELAVSGETGNDKGFVDVDIMINSDGLYLTQDHIDQATAYDNGDKKDHDTTTEDAHKQDKSARQTIKERFGDSPQPTVTPKTPEYTPPKAIPETKPDDDNNKTNTMDRTSLKVVGKMKNHTVYRYVFQHDNSQIGAAKKKIKSILGIHNHIDDIIPVMADSKQGWIYVPERRIKETYKKGDDLTIIIKD